MNIIDLRSDTLTKFDNNDLLGFDLAKIGDDCYNEDLYTIELEEYCAELFGMKAGLFLATGTMSNIVGTRALIPHGGELICERGYHINFYEATQAAALNGSILTPIDTKDGIIRIRDIDFALNNRGRYNDVIIKPKVVFLESSINSYGGKNFPIGEIKQIYEYAQDRNLQVFIDGARILNSCVATNTKPSEYGEACDMITTCFAKGLGAPFGAVLMGDADKIELARTYRKWFGGGLHQSGLMAFLALKRLKNWQERLAIDHENAQILARELEAHVEIIYPVETNMLMIAVRDAGDMVARLNQRGVKVLRWKSGVIRLVTSSNVDNKQVLKAASIIIEELKNSNNI